MKDIDPCNDCTIFDNCDESCVHSDAFQEHRNYLCGQADALGMESLTEEQQCIVLGEEYSE